MVCAHGSLTLSVQEVVDGDWVATLGVVRCLTEHLVDVLLGTDAHVLLTKRLHVIANVVLLLPCVLALDDD